MMAFGGMNAILIMLFASLQFIQLTEPTKDPTKEPTAVPRPKLTPGKNETASIVEISIVLSLPRYTA